MTKKTDHFFVQPERAGSVGPNPGPGRSGGGFGSGGAGGSLEGELKTFNSIYLGLLSFLTLTIASSFIKMGLFNPVANFTFATFKACLVIWFFMEVRKNSSQLLVFVFAGFFWLIILVGFVFSDFMTRGHLPVLGK